MEIESENSQSEVDFIKDKPHLIFLIQKVERLSGVIHILTFNMSEKEPLRANLRESCLLFLRHAYNRDLENRYATSLESDVAHIVSLLNIGSSSLSISQMNAQILKNELLALLPSIALLHQKERTDTSFDEKILMTGIGKGHTGMSHKDYRLKFLERTNKTFDDVKKVNIEKASNIKPESVRKKIIIEVIRNKKEVSIKDISLQVQGVSGKTIQRDLLELVSHGVLKKTGERRWSKYSLV